MNKKGKTSDVSVKETPDEEYFDRQSDPYVLPPELNVSVRDGFRFGIGLILAMLIFWAIAAAGIVLFFSLGLVG